MARSRHLSRLVKVALQFECGGVTVIYTVRYMLEFLLIAAHKLHSGLLRAPLPPRLLRLVLARYRLEYTAYVSYSVVGVLQGITFSGRPTLRSLVARFRVNKPLLLLLRLLLLRLLRLLP